MALYRGILALAGRRSTRRDRTGSRPGSSVTGQRRAAVIGAAVVMTLWLMALAWVIADKVSRAWEWFDRRHKAR